MHDDMKLLCKVARWYEGFNAGGTGITWKGALQCDRHRRISFRLDCSAEGAPMR